MKQKRYITVEIRARELGYIIYDSDNIRYLRECIAKKQGRKELKYPYFFKVTSTLDKYIHEFFQD